MFMEDAGTKNIAPVDRMAPAPICTPQGGSTETLPILLGAEGAEERQESPSGGSTFPAMLRVDRRCLGVKNTLPL